MTFPQHSLTFPYDIELLASNLHYSAYQLVDVTSDASHEDYDYTNL